MLGLVARVRVRVRVRVMVRVRVRVLHFLVAFASLKC